MLRGRRRRELRRWPLGVVGTRPMRCSSAPGVSANLEHHFVHSRLVGVGSGGVGPGRDHRFLRLVAGTATEENNASETGRHAEERASGCRPIPRNRHDRSGTSSNCSRSHDGARGPATTLRARRAALLILRRRRLGIATVTRCRLHGS